MNPEEINAIRIHFDDNMIIIMNLCLAFVMFGVALNLKLEDFRSIAKHPSKILIGLSSQLLLLPLLTIIFIYFLNLPYSMSLGMVLVACCPGGNISNYATFLSRGNTALSITLTSLVTLFAAFITPLSFFFWGQWIPVDDTSTPLDIQLSFSKMFIIVLQLILVPLIVGMLLSRFFPQWVDRIKKPISQFSLIIFIGFIIGALYGNFDLILDYVYLVFWIVVLHNGTALFSGYLFSKSWGLNNRDARAIALETGVQNAGLGLVLVFNFFEGLGGMILIVAWWGIWDMVSSFLLALFWRYKTQPTATVLRRE
jgi:BASS family bile acid:Na+ symporter